MRRLIAFWNAIGFKNLKSAVAFLLHGCSKNATLLLDFRRSVGLASQKSSVNSVQYVANINFLRMARPLRFRVGRY